MEKFVCVKCGKPLEEPSGAGRAPRYCSVACRRAAEFELRRIQRHLERLEQQRMELAHHNLLDVRDYRGHTLEQQREDNVRAIAELEARLAALLEAEADSPAGAWEHK